MESSRVRLAADVGDLHGCRRVRRDDGELKLGKTLTTPVRLVDGIENGVTKAGASFRAARLFLHGTTVAIKHHPGAHRRKVRAAHHSGLPRHLRDRRVNRPESYNLFFTGTSR